MYNQAITQIVEYFDMSKDMYCKEDLFIPLLNTQILHLTVILIHVSPPLLYTSLAIVIIFIREGFKKKKKIWNFPYFSGVGGFEKVIFHKK